MPKTDTKSRILTECLTLFSKYEYDGVFMLHCKYDSQPDKESEALSILERHVASFDAAYRNEDIK